VELRVKILSYSDLGKLQLRDPLVNACDSEMLESLHRGDALSVFFEVSQQTLALALFLGGLHSLVS
jgi:hypothetical protein